MTNEMEKAKRSKGTDEELVEANTSKPPQPPFAGAGRIKIKKKPPKKVVLPINNPAQAVPSHQPTWGAGRRTTWCCYAEYITCSSKSGADRGQYTRGRQTSSGQY